MSARAYALEALCESQSLETVRQVEAIVAGEVPAGAVNADRWTRTPSMTW
jgi:hypothetical protein